MTPKPDNLPAPADLIAAAREDLRLFEALGKPRALELIAALEAMQWRPIETAPRDGTEILTIRENGFIGKAVWYDNPFGRKDTVIENASGKWWSVTHWKPLDAPPAPEAAKEVDHG